MECGIQLLIFAILFCVVLESSGQEQNPLDFIAELVRQRLQEVNNQNNQNVQNNPNNNNQDRVISLGYNPKPSSYYPVPTYTPQLIPPGQPWPANAAEYDNFGQGSSANNQNNQPSSLGDRLGENTGSNPNQNLKPERPNPAPVSSFYPVPVFIPQLIPSGNPWPSNAEDYNNFGQAQKPVNLEDRLQEQVTTKRPSVVQVPETIPIRPPSKPSSFHPVPIFTPQLIPSGTPWPASANDYQNFSQTTEDQRRTTVTLDDRISEVTSQKPQYIIETIPARPIAPIVPRPSYNPVPSQISQLIPPGKPWPATQQDYQNFSQIAPQRPINVNLEDRINEPAIVVRPVQGQVSDVIPIRPSVKPSSFHPVPTQIAQLIPPGKPWPAKAEEEEEIPLGNRFKGEQQAVPTRRPMSTSTFPSLLHSQDGAQKNPQHVSVHRSQQIIFPDDESFANVASTIELYDKHKAATEKPQSITPNLLHSQFLETNKENNPPPRPQVIQVLDTPNLHTSPDKITPIPPIGSLFTSRPGIIIQNKQILVSHSHSHSQTHSNGQSHTLSHSQHSYKETTNNKPLEEPKKKPIIIENPNIAVANLLPDSVRITDVGFTGENLSGKPNHNAVNPPDYILTSATIISSMQQHEKISLVPEKIYTHHSHPKSTYT